MLVTFLDRACGTRNGPKYMPGEQADLPDYAAKELIEMGVAEAAEPPGGDTVPKAPERPPVDKMFRKGDGKVK